MSGIHVGNEGAQRPATYQRFVLGSRAAKPSERRPKERARSAAPVALPGFVPMRHVRTASRRLIQGSPTRPRRQTLAGRCGRKCQTQLDSRSPPSGWAPSAGGRHRRGGPQDRSPTREDHQFGLQNASRDCSCIRRSARGGRRMVAMVVNRRRPTGGRAPLHRDTQGRTEVHGYLAPSHQEITTGAHPSRRDPNTGFHHGLLGTFVLFCKACERTWTERRAEQD
jgi:hypothetical protein